MTPAERAQARQVFEETLSRVVQRHVPLEEVMVEARMTDATGQPVVVARYTLHPDGHVECCEILDEVLWPRL